MASSSPFLGELCYFYTMEIERKYLVDTFGWNNLNKPEGVKIIQGYLCSQPNKTIRVRIKGDKSYMTIKGESHGISREEIEFEIPGDKAQKLMEKFCDTLIEKVRYTIDYANKLWEVDVFEGQNAGLILAEIELNNEDETFLIPNWITQEVSGDIRYYNSYLAENPYRNWSNTHIQ